MAASAGELKLAGLIRVTDLQPYTAALDVVGGPSWRFP